MPVSYVCFLFCPLKPGHSVPNPIHRQGNYTMQSGNSVGGDHPHPFPGYKLTRATAVSLSVSYTIRNMSSVFQQTLLSSFSIKSVPPKATHLDPASLATDQIAFTVSHLGVPRPTFIKAFVVDGFVVIVALCPLSKLPHGKMILEKCARKNFTSPEELVDFSLSDQEICVINLIFISSLLPSSTDQIRCSRRTTTLANFFLSVTSIFYLCFLILLHKAVCNSSLHPG